MVSATVSQFPLISGYTLVEQIYDGARTAVYRAEVNANGLTSGRSAARSSSSGADNRAASVIIKVLQNPQPSSRDLAQFRNQYNLLQALSIPGIPRPLELKIWKNGYALVTEDFGGISLQQHIQARSLHTTEKLTEFLEVGIQLASLLHELGQRQIIHKDINPANILIRPDSKQIQLIDFSIASRLPKETQAVQTLNKLEGTLAYIAPEQTGRMNRAIDYRTDFYSLGVTLYELLTGQLPFEASDPMALVHCHITKTPASLHHIDSAIPAMLSAVILKLMAKNAEERYQSALGIKHDLSECLEQLKRTGDIVEFPIGMRDSSARFSISERLYGREREVEILLYAYDRVVSGQCDTELMLVAGISGIGKTVVINEVHKPLSRHQGYFIEGKFDQLNRSNPLSAFLQAIQGLIAQVLTESDAQISHKRGKILAALGEEAQVLIEAIPNLEDIIGAQPAVPALSLNEAQNRFNILFQKFVSVFTGPQRPLVIFLDDLQWIDLASLQLLQQLIEKQKHLLVLGAYRENEVSAAHPFMQMVETIKHSSSVKCITLSPLGYEDTNRLVADTLRCSAERSQPISDLIYRKTKGNPFFTTQFLKSLYEESHIRFNDSQGTWECDIEKVSQLSFSEDVVDFMVQRLKKLPPDTQNLLAIAACIGNRFTLSTLAIAAEKPLQDAAKQLWVSIEEALVIPKRGVYTLYEIQENEIQENETQENQGLTEPASNAAVSDPATSDSSLANSNAAQSEIYQFLHDRVQQAAYALIAEDAEQQQRTHLTIGRRLLADTRDLEKIDNLFELVGHLNKGAALLENAAEQQQLVELNLMAGEKAKASSDYQTAMQCYMAGIGLLPPDCWTRTYALTRELYQSAAEAALLAGDFDQMDVWASAVIERTNSPADNAKAYEIKIQAANSQHRFLQAIAIAKEALEPFGIRIPESPMPADIQQAFQSTSQLLQGKDIAALANLPDIESADKRAIIQLTSAVLPAAFLGVPPLFPLFICVQIRTLVENGSAPTSAYSYACYALLLNIILNDIETAKQFAQLAVTLVDESPSKSLQSQTYFVVAAFITHHISPLKSAQQRLIRSYQLGLEGGSHEYAGYAAHHICNNAYLMGTSLDELKLSIEAYCQTLSKLKQTVTLNYCQMTYQAVLNLTQVSAEPLSLSDESTEPSKDNKSYALLQGDEFDERAALASMQADNNITGLYQLYIHKLILSFLFGEISAAQAAANDIRPYLAGADGFSTKPLFYFYDSLVLISAYSARLEAASPDSTGSDLTGSDLTGSDLTGSDLTSLNEPAADLSDTLSQIDKNQEKLKHWATYAPMNYQHKVDLVEAERHRIENKPYMAMELYDRAIAGAKQHGFIQEEALANELAAQFYLDRKQQQIAVGYLREACYGYSHWEASAKVAQLEALYPELLTAVAARSKPQTITSVYQNTRLDFLSVSKAAQAISQEMKLESLLETLMEIMITNAGAQRGYFILSQAYGGHDGIDSNVMEPIAAGSEADKLSSKAGDSKKVKRSQAKWMVVAEASQSEISITQTPLAQSTKLPQSLIHSVIRSKQTALFENLSHDKSFKCDRYIFHNQPLSVLCMPISRQGRLIGVLYLENNAAAGAFSRDRLATLQLLINQAAISLENAALYRQTERYSSQLEAEVSRKTQSLNEKVIALENTLLQLKKTQSQLIQSEKMSSLGQLVAGVAHEINNPVNFIYANIKHIERYTQDLMNIISLYQEHCYPIQPATVREFTEDIDFEFLTEDAQSLLMSMRNGSDRIKEIVLSLKNFSHLDEAVFKEVDIHKGLESTLTLLQRRLRAANIFRSIKVERSYGEIPSVMCYPSLLNQVFMYILNNAIDALEETSSESKAAHQKKIQISTESLDNNWVAIRIADNGVGISPEIKARIFDPFFTTKPVGKGKGLGLSVSYQIITEKHHGKLYCRDTKVGAELVIELPVK